METGRFTFSKDGNNNTICQENLQYIKDSIKFVTVIFYSVLHRHLYNLRVFHETSESKYKIAICVSISTFKYFPIYQNWQFLFEGIQDSLQMTAAERFEVGKWGRELVHWVMWILRVRHITSGSHIILKKGIPFFRLSPIFTCCMRRHGSKLLSSLHSKTIYLNTEFADCRWLFGGSFVYSWEGSRTRLVGNLPTAYYLLVIHIRMGLIHKRTQIFVSQLSEKRMGILGIMIPFKIRTEACYFRLSTTHQRKVCPPTDHYPSGEHKRAQRMSRRILVMKSVPIMGARKMGQTG